MMQKFSLPILFAVSLTVATPVISQDIGDIVSGVAKSLITQELDQNAFREAQRLNTASAYRNYLTQFPRGAHSSTAQSALSQLTGSVDPGISLPAPRANASAASIEASLGLTRTQRTQIQAQLSSLGFSSGIADGFWGANTRNAISQWQTKNKITATGYVDARQVNLIQQQAGPVRGANTNTSMVPDDPVEERLLGLTSGERREIQRRLTQLGYNTGGVDGSFGANTRRAVASWQRDEGLRASGYITADQLRELRRQTAG